MTTEHNNEQETKQIKVQFGTPECGRYGNTLINREKRRKGNIDWDEVRNAYVYAEPEVDKKRTTIRYPSMRDIAEQYEIQMNMLLEKASREGWKNLRDDYHRKIRDLHTREMDIISLRRSALHDSENLRRLEQFGKMFDAWLKQNLPDMDDDQRAKYLALCAEEGVSPDEDDKTYVEGIGEASEDISVADIKDLSVAMDVMQKMHKMNRDIMGEPINYEKFYAERAKEDRRVAEKGKAVTRSDIRDLISSLRNEPKGKKVTLDVDAEEVKKINDRA